MSLKLATETLCKNKQTKILPKCQFRYSTKTPWWQLRCKIHIWRWCDKYTSVPRVQMRQDTTVRWSDHWNRRFQRKWLNIEFNRKFTSSRMNRMHQCTYRNCIELKILQPLHRKYFWILTRTVPLAVNLMGRCCHNRHLSAYRKCHFHGFLGSLRYICRTIRCPCFPRLKSVDCRVKRSIPKRIPHRSDSSSDTTVMRSDQFYQRISLRKLLVNIKLVNCLFKEWFPHSSPHLYSVNLLFSNVE